MRSLRRQISRASRTIINVPPPAQRVAPRASWLLALSLSPPNCRPIHSWVPVTPDKRPSPQRVHFPVGSPVPRLAQGGTSYVTQNVAPNPEPVIHHEFEPNTGTWQYVVADPASGRAAIIDPVLDYDPTTQLITNAAADSLLSLVKDRGIAVEWILETHAHADHLTAASYLQARLAQNQAGQKPPIGIGKRIDQVQGLFGQRYGIAADEYANVFDKLFDDDETFSIGGLKASTIHLPGHTPDHLGYKVGGESEEFLQGYNVSFRLSHTNVREPLADNVFCGDSLFHVDIGTARCDFPGGSAQSLWSSTRKLLNLPEHVKIWTGHDYPPGGRKDPVPCMTVKDHRSENIHIRDSITKEKFLALRTQRDQQLGTPRLLHPSLQMNIRAGRLPRPTQAGQRLLHLPLKLGGSEW